jgi:serine/threonine protein phosphatase 1
VSEKPTGRPVPADPAETRALLPAGLRIYAIGDIHGRFDLLETLSAAIRRDVESLRPQESIEIYLGDYIDRGPGSCNVLNWLIQSPPLTGRRVCLIGNHEAMLLEVLHDAEGMSNWLHNGAMATLASYGITIPSAVSAWTVVELREAFIGAFPSQHRAFVEALPRWVEFGRYLFVHAGIRPGRALERQDPEDFVWIRDPFLLSDADFGRIVVHGHTPVEQPEIRRNRINIDTGAFFTGRLTCLILEGDSRRFLHTAPE